MKQLEQLRKLLPSTNNPPVIAKTISCFVMIPTAPSDPPSARDPVSPIKILAGGALNHKKPKQAPMIDPQNIRHFTNTLNVGYLQIV